MIQHPKCKACNLPIKERKALDRALIRQEPITALSRHYNLSRDVLYRHRDGHIPGSVALGGRKIAENYGSNLLEAMLEKMNELTQRTESLLDKAEGKDQVRNALLAIQQLRNNLEVQGKIVSSMNQGALGLSSDEVDEYREWKAAQGSVNLDLFSKEDQQLIRAVCIEKLARMGSIEEVEDFRSKSFVMQEYGPTDAELVEEVPDSTPGGDRSILTVSTDRGEQDLEYRVDPSDSSMKPVRTTPRKPDPDPPMRRTRFD